MERKICRAFHFAEILFYFMIFYKFILHNGLLFVFDFDLALK